MKANQLKIGDRIKIIDVPGRGVPNYSIHRDTVRVYKTIIARRRAVVIDKIDKFGAPWYTIKLKRKNGKWERHFLAVYDDDNNWIPVKSRKPR